MKFGSLFSGIGGFDLGLERAGMTCAWQCEIDDKASQVLARHWPNVKRYKDVRDIGARNLEPVDLICGGFPCQDVSLAGERAGLEGHRSTLWTEFARIVRELRPRWVVVENVLGLLSSDAGQFFGNILRDLAQSGYAAEWDVLPAYPFGSPQRRERVFLVAYSQNTIQPGSLLESSRVWGSQEQPGRLHGDTRRLDAREWPDEPEPRMVRVADGLSAQVDARIHQLGNALVPQAAEWIGCRIMSTLEPV